MIRYFLILMIILIAAYPKPLLADETMPVAGVRYMENYRYQRSLYLFLTGNYLSLPEFRDDFFDPSTRNKDLILRRLSDSRMQDKGDYPGFSEPLSVDIPFQISLLDASYKTKEYEETLALSKIFDSGAARYFEGMSHLRLDRLKEARTALVRVPADDIFYPYARITLAQTAVMDKNLLEAEGYLKDIIVHPSAKRGGIDDRAHLLRGQLLFERGSFTEAIDEFSKVPFDSPLFGEAIVGQTWGMVRLNDCARAIPILEGMNLYPPYDAVRRDALAILGYCYMEAGTLSQVRGHYQRLLNSIIATEERLGEIIRDRSVSQKYAALLLKGEPSSLTDEERHYLSAFEDDPAFSSLLMEYRSLQILKKGFLEKEVETMGKEAYIENSISGLTERATKIEEDINRSVSIIKEIRRRGRQRINIEREKSGIAVTYFADVLINYWEQTLGRKVSGEAKQLVLLIMRDWIDAGSPDCRNPFFICNIVSFVNPMSRVDERPERVPEIVGIIEAIGNDLTNMRQGKKSRFETISPEIFKKAEKKIEEDRKALKRLQKIREETRNNLLEAEKGLEKTQAGMERYITERFVKAKYELADFKAGITAGLDVPKR